MTLQQNRSVSVMRFSEIVAVLECFPGGPICSRDCILTRQRAISHRSHQYITISQPRVSLSIRRIELGSPTEIIDSLLNVFTVAQSPILSSLQIKFVRIGAAIFVRRYQLEQGLVVFIRGQLKLKRCLQRNSLLESRDLVGTKWV